jgi:hypothetical protein
MIAADDDHILREPDNFSGIAPQLHRCLIRSLQSKNIQESPLPTRSRPPVVGNSEESAAFSLEIQLTDAKANVYG